MVNNVSKGVLFLMCYDDMIKRIFGVFGFGDDKMTLGGISLVSVLRMELYSHSIYTLAMLVYFIYYSPRR
jgi:hypothetical protein